MFAVLRCCFSFNVQHNIFILGCVSNVESTQVEFLMDKLLFTTQILWRNFSHVAVLKWTASNLEGLKQCCSGQQAKIYVQVCLISCFADCRWSREESGILFYFIFSVPNIPAGPLRAPHIDGQNEILELEICQVCLNLCLRMVLPLKQRQ